MKKLILSLLLGAVGFCAFAESPSFSGRAELDSRYIWRGTEWSSAPTFHPELNMEWGNFNVNVWGARSFDESYSELDFMLSYSIGDLTINLCDMFYPSAFNKEDNYFNWKSEETSRQVDLFVTYEPENLPIRALLSTLISGDDFHPDTGERAFSTYAQFEWYHDFGQSNEISAFAGASILPGTYTDYEEDFSVVNVGVKYQKTFSFKNIEIPLTTSYIINPFLEKAFLTFTAAIEF